MTHPKNTTTFTAIFTLAALSTSAAFAASTPYDLIRPTWPLNWDAKDEYIKTPEKYKEKVKKWVKDYSFKKNTE